MKQPIRLSGYPILFLTCRQKKAFRILKSSVCFPVRDKQAILPSILAFCFMCFHTVGFAQDTTTNRMTKMEDIFKLAVSNSTQLKVVAKNTDLARQEAEINKLNRLPGLSTNISYGYLSNSDVWTPSFSKHVVDPIPHQLTQFSLEAGEIIFKGNEVNNIIRKSIIEEQLAALNLEKNTVDVKFLVAAKYLDIYRLTEQKKVFNSNLKLARYRLKNIQAMQKQGMVTRNDLLRTQLTISDLQLTIKQINNNIIILNKQLNMVTGQPDSSRLIPDTTLLKRKYINEPLSYFMNEAYNNNYELKIAGNEKKVSALNVKLSGSDRYPQLSLFVGSDLQRPYVYSEPKVDIFYNIWQAGLSLKYNISSIYQSPRKIKAGKIKLEESELNEVLQKQNVEVAVSSSYIKYNEAKEDLQTYRTDLKSAEENYRIVEKKYFNQLALLTDILDASTTKLEAELKVTNAEVNVVYTYYQLSQSIGNIN